MFEGVATLLWYVGLCVGHVTWLAFFVNWWSGVIRHNKTLSIVRLIHFFLIGIAPAVFWVLCDLPPFSHSSLGEPARSLFTAYGYFCCLLGFGVLPIVTVWRLLPRRRAALLSNHTRVVDVARELGYKPYGEGKYPWLARLPRNEIFQVEFAERTLRLPRLPAAWDGLSILHLSDLHFHGTPDKVFFQKVMDQCRDWAPDLVAFTGDTVDSRRHHRWIVPVLGRLRWKIAAFAILGNHDYWKEPNLLRRRLRRIGMTVLDNQWRQIEVRGEPLIVIGHEGPWFRPEPDLRDLRGLTPPDSPGPSGSPGPFRLLLSHTPDNIRWAQKNDVDLMLAGHNHGGQIRFPILGSIFVPSRYSRRYDQGIFDEPPTLLHVTRGLSGQHPLRYNCRPEVVKIVLRGKVLK